jgi:hypothetical protein
LTAQTKEEMSLSYCLVEAMPTMKKNNTGPEWRCVVRVPADLWTEEERLYELRATAYAKKAQKHRLRPSDVVALTGMPSLKEIPLAGGEVKRVYQFAVSRPEVVSRAKRTSVTVYEQQRRK